MQTRLFPAGIRRLRVRFMPPDPGWRLVPEYSEGDDLLSMPERNAPPGKQRALGEPRRLRVRVSLAAMGMGACGSPALIGAEKGIGAMTGSMVGLALLARRAEFARYPYYRTLSTDSTPQFRHYRFGRPSEPHFVVSADFGAPDLLQGSSQLPYPDRGYWAQSEAGPNSSRQLSVPDQPGTEILSDSPRIFWRCLGYGMCAENFACDRGYAGRLCSQCQPGHLLWRGTCESQCEDLKAPGFVNALAIGAVVTVWVAMNRLTAGSCVSLGVLAVPA